jgi:hypothetical protein
MRRQKYRSSEGTNSSMTLAFSWISGAMKLSDWA